MIKIPSCLPANRSASQLNRFAFLPYDNDRAASSSTIVLLCFLSIGSLLFEVDLKGLEEGMRSNDF